MLNFLARFRRPVEPTIELDLDALAPEVAEHVRAVLMPREPSIETVRASWQAMFDEQTETLDAVIAALEASNEVVGAARNLMTVMAARSQRGNSLFLINDEASFGEADMLRHAIVTLQAHLEGTELPAMVSIDRVTH